MCKAAVAMSSLALALEKIRRQIHDHLRIVYVSRW